ncbi:MAG: hypothetical protein IIA59_11345 [Candidatus Marinimicrobia bacterium]|nr:hypothetical protein [Candidatus Neomarinimicrobiota bacterium]
MRNQSFVIAAILALFAVEPVSATVKLAIASGATCGQCHVSPSGGAMRTDYGLSEMILTELPRPRKNKSAQKFSAKLGDNLRWGMDTRIQGFAFGIDTSAATDPLSGIFPMQMAVYGQVQAGERLEFVALVYMLQRETQFWATLMGKRGTHYFRAGKFLPAYGLKLDDHTAFIRGGNVGRIIVANLFKEGLPFEPTIHGSGIAEAGIYLGDWHISSSLANPFLLASSAGANFQGTNFTLRSEIITFISGLNMSFMAGGSYMEEGGLKLSGLFGGVHWKKFSLIGELDRVTGWSGAGITAVASYADLGYDLKSWIQSYVRYHFYDNDISVLGNALTRLVVGASIFPTTFVEVTPQIRINTNTLGKPTTIDILLQLHTFF